MNQFPCSKDRIVRLGMKLRSSARPPQVLTLAGRSRQHCAQPGSDRRRLRTSAGQTRPWSTSSPVANRCRRALPLREALLPTRPRRAQQAQPHQRRTASSASSRQVNPRLHRRRQHVMPMPGPSKWLRTQCRAHRLPRPLDTRPRRRRPDAWRRRPKSGAASWRSWLLPPSWPQGRTSRTHVRKRPPRLRLAQKKHQALSSCPCRILCAAWRPTQAVFVGGGPNHAHLARHPQPAVFTSPARMCCAQLAAHWTRRRHSACLPTGVTGRLQRHPGYSRGQGRLARTIEA